MFKKATPLLLIFVSFLSYTCQRLDGSFTLLSKGLVKAGPMIFFKEIFSFPVQSIVFACCLYLFIITIAPKFSLLFTSGCLLLFYYLFFSPTLIYSYFGALVLPFANPFNEKKQSEHLFYALFFLTLLHTVSAVHLSTLFYGINKPLLLMATAPFIFLIYLGKTTIYPSKVTLCLIFPLTILPVSYCVHNTISLDFLSIYNYGCLISTLIFLLEKRGISEHLALSFFSICAVALCPKEAFFPFIWTPLIGLITLHYKKRGRGLLTSRAFIPVKLV
jgi:hypothetical protein